MNVKEIIKKLRKFSPTRTVFIADPETCENDRDIGAIQIDLDNSGVAIYPRPKGWKQ